MNQDNIIKQTAKIIAEAEAICIMAGAGMGVDSGLPDFRGNEGFWKAYPPVAKLGISFVEIANPQWFFSNPKLAWAFYGHRLNLYRKTTPHAGFNQLLKIAKEKTEGYFVFTSNVDGQFQKAGFSDDTIEECHGSIHYLQCISGCNNNIWSAEKVQVIVDEEKFVAQEPLPSCPYCGGLARPNILMFGDWTWNSDRTNLQSRTFSDWLNKISSKKSKLVIIELGAGKAVATVRMQSETLCYQYDGSLIRINPRDFDVPHGHIGISAGAAEGIAKIFANV